jgi:hypothetical protein
MLVKRSYILWCSICVVVWLTWHVMELCLQSCHVCLAVGCAGGVIEQVVQGSESQNPAKVRIFLDGSRAKP